MPCRILLTLAGCLVTLAHSQTIRCEGKNISKITEEDVVLSCVVTSNEKITNANWTKTDNSKPITDGIKLLGNTSSLTLKQPVDPPAAGKYNCELTFENGQKRSCTADLNYAPQPATKSFLEAKYPNYRQPSVLVVEGEGADISCKFEGTVPMNIVWTKVTTESEKKVENMATLDNKTYVLSSSSPTSMSLKISNANSKERADYQCTATNIAGTAVMITLLRVRSPLLPLWPCITILVVLGLTGLSIFTLSRRREASVDANADKNGELSSGNYGKPKNPTRRQVEEKDL